MNISPNLHAVILAGGSGTRFWPVSRQSRPKQFLDLVGKESLLRQTIRRVAPKVSAQNIWIVASRAHRKEINRQAAGLGLRASQILWEPKGKNTAPAIAAAASPGDEIDELTRAFDHYLTRLAAFIERERAFAADASHELRTPLAVIRAAAEVLADDPRLTPDQAVRIARIERATVEMAELIAALLLLAREETTSTEESCDATRIAADCIERYRPLALSRDTHIGLDAATVQLRAPPALFAIVVTNLVHNAVAHTREGRIAVTLDASTLVVRDTGSGIRGEALGHVFERYYRGADSAGAGIGLSLIKRICDRIDWRIDLQSDPVKGTTATLKF